MATTFQRMAQAMAQLQDRHRGLIEGSTHESWLLSQKSMEIFKATEKRHAENWDIVDSSMAARIETNAWIMSEIASGRSKEYYSKEEYIAAGGTDKDYDYVIAVQQKRAEYIALRKECERLRPKVNTERQHGS